MERGLSRVVVDTPSALQEERPKFLSKMASRLGPTRSLWHDPQAPDFKCTFCHAVRQVDGPWHAPETLAEAHPTAVSFTVCEPCEALVDEALQALRANRKPSGQLTKGFGPGSAGE